MSSTTSSAITHDSPSSPTHIAFDPSRLVGSREDLRKLVAQETQRHIQVIDETIDVITKLRTFHNSLAPVNALPAELLGVIFAHLVSQGDLLPKPSRGRDHGPGRLGDSVVAPPRGARDIVGAARVCKYWCTVIVQNPWLWTSFPIHDHVGVKEFLTRSKNLPISLSLTHRFSSNFAPVLAPSTHRIRSLHISTILADDIEMLWTELSCPAPNLQELFIEHLPRNFFVHGHAVGRVVQLSPMFNGEAPSLRVLTLRGVPSPFKVLPPSLVHLSVGTMQGPLPPFAELLEMLGNCPLLETLDLRGTWEWDEFTDHPLVRNGVALPKLAATYLELEPQEAPGMLLSSLALPPHTDVSIAAVLEDGRDFVHILDTIVPPLAPSCFVGFRRLQLFRERKDWRLQAFRDPDAFLDPPALDIDCIDPWGDPQVDWTGFLFDWSFDASQIETLVLGYKQGRHIPVGGVEPVNLNRMFDQWDVLFGQLPALKTLRVMGLPTSELESLLLALRERAPDPGDADGWGLTTLEVFDVQISLKAAERLLGVGLSRGGLQKSTVKRVELFNSKPNEFGYLQCLRLISLGVELVIDEEIMNLGLDARD
ncbi:hypothetical protein LXA43DRAFT_641383 [Ganoderma leucocontextum]|nr:hypothetical protein LXA43DRAFT_641383 [Ganoderma leucocontextum]